MNVILLTLCSVLCASLGVDAELGTAEKDLFYNADKNNGSLTMSDCRDMWLTFDGDNDQQISKLEFEVRWTFSGLANQEHSIAFFYQLDRNRDGHLGHKDINNICHFFDDDQDQHISFNEFRMNWLGMFGSP